MCLRPIRKSWGALLRPSCVSASDYGLELTVERGTGIGPWACCSSDRPMHSPVLAPVHGMLSISGSPPGEVSPATGEFGTRSGTHTPVKVSSDSPPGHAAIVGELVDTATTASAGAAATATANPPARISRRAGSFRVAIITLSVVALLIVCRGNRYRRCQLSARAPRVPCRWLVRSCGGRGHLLSQTLRRVPGKRGPIVNKNGAYVPFLGACCQLAVAPLHGRLLWHRNVQSARSFPSERGGPLWLALI